METEIEQKYDTTMEQTPGGMRELPISKMKSLLFRRRTTIEYDDYQ